MAKKTDLTGLMARKKLTPEPVQKEEGSGVVKRRTLSFGESDERELDRVEAYLREKGFARVATAKVIRIALRVAFRDDLTGEGIREIVEGVLEDDGRRKG